MKLVVGLGNPGRRYEGSRHNLGYAVLAELARRLQPGSAKAKFFGELIETIVDGQKLLLLSPTTYMNRSGTSVLAVRDFYGLANEDMLVICDDLSLPPGKLRLRANGSSGGQKGLEDIIRRLGTDEYPAASSGNWAFSPRLGGGRLRSGPVPERGIARDRSGGWQGRGRRVDVDPRRPPGLHEPLQLNRTSQTYEEGVLATNVYEGMFILDSGRYGRDPEGVSGQISKAVQEVGGEMLVSRLWEERRLAYPIKGQRKGTYWLAYFRLPAGALTTIRQRYQLSDSILRMLFLKVDPRIVDTLVQHALAGPAAIGAERRAAEAAQAAAAERRTPVEGAPEEALSPE